MSAADWLRLRPLIERALLHNGGTHTIEDIDEGVRTGALQFWGGDDWAAITQIIDYPRLRALSVFLVGGNLVALRQVEPRLCVFARAQGCARIQGTGRKGWAGLASDWRAVAVTMVKEL